MACHFFRVGRSSYRRFLFNQGQIIQIVANPGAAAAAAVIRLTSLACRQSTRPKIPQIGGLKICQSIRF